MGNCTVTGWYVLSFVDTPDLKIVYGVIQYDSKRRLPPGGWVATSPMIDWHDNVFITRNTCYLLRGTGFYLTLQNRVVSSWWFTLGFNPIDVLAPENLALIDPKQDRSNG